MSEPARSAVPDIAAAGASLKTADCADASPSGERNLNLPRSYVLTPDGKFQRDLLPKQIAERLVSGSGMMWIDIDSCNRHQVALLEKVFQFHPLTIEDVLNPNSRVKFEEYDGYIFCIIRGIQFHEATEDPYDLETYNLCFYLGKNFVVTTHAVQSPSVGAIGDLVDRSPDLLTRAPARLMHAIMDSAVDAYFPILDQVDDFVDGLEERVFGDFDSEVLRDIFSVKRLVLSLRRHLMPQREVFNILTHRPNALLPPEIQVYYRDIYDHVLRINDSIETYRDLLSSTMDSYLTQVSNRLSSVTKALSIFATVSLPFVVVSGMWGMNFVKVPLAANPYGFEIMVLVQIGIALGLFAFLKRRGFL